MDSEHESACVRNHIAFKELLAGNNIATCITAEFCEEVNFTKREIKFRK